MSSLQDYLRDQLLLDQELEAIKIKLASERDFYPRFCFEKYLANDDYTTCADRIFKFMTEYPCNEIGQFALNDVEDYLAAYTQKKYAVEGR